MSERNRNQKRRDKKGRILRNGESQRADGRYAFVYTDCFGKQKFLYSWKLESTDPLPVGRRPCQSLREKEKVILRDINDGITPYGDNLTVLELVKKYIAQKTGVRHNTAANYNFVINIIKKEEFGALRIDKVKLSDAKAWLIKLQADGRGYSTIHSVRGVVRPAFQMAVDDDLIRKNPFEFQLCTVVVNDSVTREAITRKQERKFLEFIKNDEHYKRYYDGMFIFFKTGLRISEFCGLTLSDIDFEEKQISVNHQLQRTRDNPKAKVRNNGQWVQFQPIPEHINFLIGNLLEDIDNVILFRLANYFLRFSQEYKRIHPDEKFMDWYEFVEYGCTNPFTIWLQRNGFTREAATYIRNNFQLYFATGEDGQYRLRLSLLECENLSVRKEARQVYYNGREIFM